MSAGQASGRRELSNDLSAWYVYTIGGVNGWCQVGPRRTRSAPLWTSKIAKFLYGVLLIAFLR